MIVVENCKLKSIFVVFFRSDYSCFSLWESARKTFVRPWYDPKLE